ncbi:MAG TPA: family 20 glycosylhydrolase [Polyangiaceae bacterium]
MSPAIPRGHHLALQWKLVSNYVEDDTFRAALTITNRGAVPLPTRGWAIYFNSCRKAKPESVTGGVAIEHVNGDLFKLVPKADFGNLAPGESREIGYDGVYWAVVKTDAPLGFFIVHGDGTPEARAEAIGDAEIAPFERPEQLARKADDQVPSRTPETRFEENRALSRLPESAIGKITPAPSSATYRAEHFILDEQSVIVHAPELTHEARFLQDALANLMNRRLPLSLIEAERAIALRLDAHMRGSGSGIGDQTYRLVVTSTGIEVASATLQTMFFGIQSLLQLLPVSAWHNPDSTLAVPHCRIDDAPRFIYRGVHFDVARNFSDKQTVLRLLDVMALYKLNKLHFHLTDDEGWRVPIASLPELTEIGSRRGFTLDESERLVPSFGSGPAPSSHGSGHYTRDEFVEILRYAAARHIEVIPEIDVPGHARAAIKAMQLRHRRLMQAGKKQEAATYLLTDLDDESQYESVQMWKDNVICIALESCYDFIETVVREIKAMYEEAGVRLQVLHTGGDEVPSGPWERSPACRSFMRERGMQSTHELQDYFLGRFRDILKRHDLVVGGWEEIALVTERQGGVDVTKPNPKFVNANFRPYVWNSVWGWGREDIAYRLANAGYEIILCNVTNLYLDLAYEKDPEEPGYYWGGFISTRKVFEFCPFDIYTTATVDLWGRPIDPATVAKMVRLTAEGEKRVLGMQGHLWGENVHNRPRAEFLLMPRLLAVAERAWARDPGWTRIGDLSERAARMERDWNEFANRLGQRELPRLDGFLGGVGYRLPVPGAVVRDRMLSANVSYPGLTLRYALEGAEPTLASPAYEGPVSIDAGKIAKVAAFSTTGRRGRSVTLSS